MTESYSNEGLAAATNLRMEFSKKISYLCASRGLDQIELNRLAGEPVSKATVSNYFTGKSKPPADVALAFARALDVDLSWLVDDAAELPAKPPAGKAISLSEKDEEVLRIVKLLGHDRALGRLLGMPVAGDFGPLP